MGINWVRYLLIFIILILFQVCIFNRIHLFGFVTPLLYIYLIIKLPMDMNRNWVVFIAFAMGLVIDRFEFVLGINALASTIVGFIRFYALKLFTPRDIVVSEAPSISNLGSGFFLKYAASLVLIHQLILYSVESLMMFNPSIFFLRVFGGFSITMLLIYAIEGINSQFFKK